MVTSARFVACRKPCSVLISLCSLFLCFHTELWWNPETLSEASKNYLHLLLELFDILVRGASEGIYADHFRAMMKLLFEVPCPLLHHPHPPS